MRLKLEACERQRPEVDEAESTSKSQGSNDSSENDEVLASLVASGCIPWPTDRVITDEDALLAKVRDLRRQRLTRFIAELIAKSFTPPEMKKDIES